MTSVKIRLPWPPSVNRMWRTPHKGPLAGRTMLSKEGRQFRADVEENLLRQGIPRRALSGRLEVTIRCWPPDRRARDLDNLPKGILDALQKSGVIDDDKLIDVLHVHRCQIMPPLGGIEVQIDETLQSAEQVPQEAA